MSGDHRNDDHRNDDHLNDDVRRSRQRISQQRFSRRRALGFGGALGLSGLLAACGADTGSSSGSAATASPTASATPTAGASTTAASTDVVAALDKALADAGRCTLAEEQTQGPYWFDVDSIRSDIREGRPGTTLTLAVRVEDVTGCAGDGSGATPVASSVVEIWHCDAGGVYSGFESGSMGGSGGAPGGAAPGGGSSGETSAGSYSAGDTEAATSDDGTYLRGAQVADARGIVQFTTVYPGWYRGRTTHIHLKVHKDKATVLTTQLFFDEAVNSEVYATAPYSDRTGRDTLNDGDSIYDATGLLALSKQAGGYLGVLNLGVDV